MGQRQQLALQALQHWVHEGGISTPFIVSWPERIDRGGTVAEPVQVIDIFATCIDAAGAAYPQELDGREITPLEGESFLPTIDGKPCRGSRRCSGSTRAIGLSGRGSGS